MSMNYKTPMKKLLKFFKDSRDKWKCRALEKQKRIEQLEIKVRDLTNSRDTWIDHTWRRKPQVKSVQRSKIIQIIKVLSFPKSR